MIRDWMLASDWSLTLKLRLSAEVKVHFTHASLSYLIRLIFQRLENTVQYSYKANSFYMTARVYELIDCKAQNQTLTTKLKPKSKRAPTFDLPTRPKLINIYKTVCTSQKFVKKQNL